MIRRTLMFAAMALAMQGAVAKDWDSIRFATEGAYPPFNTVDTSGAVQGFDVDVANALCEEMKAKCTWVKQEWDGMIPALLSRQVRRHLGLDVDHRRAQEALSISPTSTTRPRSAWYRRRVAGWFPSSTCSRASASRSAAPWPTPATRFWAEQGITVVRYARQEEAYLDLSAGRIDVAWADALVADGALLSFVPLTHLAVQAAVLLKIPNSLKTILSQGLHLQE